MDKLINWLENSFAPKLNKIGHLSWVVILKDSVMQILPFILLGSVFCVLGILNDYFPNLPSFWTPFGWTMGKLSLFVAFLVPFNYCKRKKLRKQRLIAGLTGLIFFLICTTPVIVKEGTVGFDSSALGAGGMFVAIVTGIITSLIFGAFGKFSFFKEDSPIPEFVRVWFDQMLPIFIVVCLGWLVVQVKNINLYNLIANLFMPLQKVLNTWYGFTIMNFIICFIYSMGISPWVLDPVTQPVKMASIAANLAMIAAGTATVANMNMFTEGTIYVTYMWVGGIACTMPLVIMLIRSKVKKLKALGRACIGSSIFNINEPVVFGCIAWNPLLMLPMWLQGIILPLLTWFFCKVIAFAPIPRIQFELWYMPYPIGTWISTRSIKAILFLILSVFVSALIWYPFFKAYEKQEYENEQASIQE
ncbi:PTS sugar transporter subunit IIC [Sporanaerobacter sp. PP17-6a]|uniref:PTS sugar transporter subunit IIC n=1 Tax=Sporanaerobacter sp. PP17-6a TaxID=1891289 RepID=UPI0008A01D84|nr:PTS transporter subunit EIIC [Sporanaerobacter sp. PP17-6a]SCL88374.1 PTS system lichenan-specific EIIC component [Sporanaerobacter sp. PP17-6a]